MEENKRLFTEKLGELLRNYAPRSEVKDMEYYIDDYGEEKVRICFQNDDYKSVNVNMDSCLAIMHDIYKALI